MVYIDDIKNYKGTWTRFLSGELEFEVGDHIFFKIALYWHVMRFDSKKEVGIEIY